jgi:hypothetical protein
MAMSFALSNVNPYIHSSDEVLAQLCQGTLSLAMTIELLEMYSVEFQDSYYGPLLLVCTMVQMIRGIVVAEIPENCGENGSIFVLP